MPGGYQESTEKDAQFRGRIFRTFSEQTKVRRTTSQATFIEQDASGDRYILIINIYMIHIM
jgi:hypothetical protein